MIAAANDRNRFCRCICFINATHKQNQFQIEPGRLDKSGEAKEQTMSAGFRPMEVQQQIVRDELRQHPIPAPRLEGSQLPMKARPMAAEKQRLRAKAVGGNDPRERSGEPPPSSAKT
jgi:hypothetical protein